MFFLSIPLRAPRVWLAVLLSIALLGTIAAGQRHRIVHAEAGPSDPPALHKLQHACAAFDCASLAAGLPAAPWRLAAAAGAGVPVACPPRAVAPAPRRFHFSARAPPDDGLLLS